jgi:hypothetical protein
MLTAEPLTYTCEFATSSYAAIAAVGGGLVAGLVIFTMWRLNEWWEDTREERNSQPLADVAEVDEDAGPDPFVAKPPKAHSWPISRSGVVHTTKCHHSGNTADWLSEDTVVEGERLAERAGLKAGRCCKPFAEAVTDVD